MSSASASNRNLFRRLAILWAFVAVGPAFGQSTAPTTSEAADAQRIAELIERLGHDFFATRRQAQLELERIGVPALEQLQAAVLHPDPQIASAARYLVRSNFVRWTGDGDPMLVRKLLENYGTSDPSFRAEKIDNLYRLPHDAGLQALLRIARFETHANLHKRAALSVLGRANATQVLGPLPNNYWDTVYQAAAPGSNTSCAWLVKVANHALGREAFDGAWWQNQVAEEVQRYRSKSPDTSRDLVESLVRWAAQRLAAADQRAAGLAMASQLFELEYPRSEVDDHSRDLMIWALEQKFPELVIELWGRLDANTKRERLLVYLVAEAHAALQQPGESETLADTAFNGWRDPDAPADLPAATPPRPSAWPNRFAPIDEDEISPYERLVVGSELRDRRQYAWAEREWRDVLARSEMTDPLYTQTVYLLAAMLVDGQDYQAAADVMVPLVELLEKDQAWTRELDAQRTRAISQNETRWSDHLRASFYHYRAQAFVAENKIAEAQSDLKKAFDIDRENVDIAITMWKLKVDENWSKEAETAVERSIRSFRRRLPQIEQVLQLSMPGELATLQRDYANTLNTYAWLLVSVGRELDIATQSSELACRLEPDREAYLDTLARCYFEAGRIEEAVALQEKAVTLDPSSREIGRALERYRQAAPR